MRRFGIALLLAFAVGCAGEAEDEESAPVASQDEIVGGRETFARDAVGVTTLDGATGCSATLVSPNVIILAAHCFPADKTTIAPWQFEIRKSKTESYRYDTGEGVVLDRRGAGDDDIALLRLVQAVPASVATPIPLAQGWPSWGTQLEMIGFGCTKRDADGIGAGVKRITTKRYTAAWDLGWVTKSSCPGDSGGALLSANGPELVGVISGWRANGYDLFGDVVKHRARLQAQIDAWR